MPSASPVKALLAITATLLAIQTTPALSQEQVGDRWTVVRGDGSPGLRYEAFVETPSGRWLAAGAGGALMLSDNSGGDWRYQVITDSSGEPFFPTITDMVVDNSGTIVATAVSTRPSTNASQLPFLGQTQILTSNNNGDTWNITDFPTNVALFNGFPIPGVFLENLFVAPNGQVLAYGTTLQASPGIGYYIGGLIFRRQGSTWEQVYFENGVLQSMNLGDNGRLVASGFQTVLDSADGAGWNGYSLVDANMNLGGQPLTFEEKELLNASDVAFVDNNYVMQTQNFRRSDRDPNVFIIANEDPAIYVSPNPFDGGRIWNGSSASQVYPNWIRTSAGLASVYFSAFTSSNGVNWNEADDTVTPRAFSVGRVDTQSLVAIGNSDEAWLSTNNGDTWSKILDTDPGPDLRFLARSQNVLLARGVFDSSVWRSVDNGNNWVEDTEFDSRTGLSGLGTITAAGDRLYQPDRNQLFVSDDTGLNWDEITIPDIDDNSPRLVVGQSDRLVIGRGSNSISNPPSIDFHTSDDGGQTWVPRPAPLGFGEGPKQGLHVGGGRIIYMMNGFASFDPELLISDDNGATWRREDPFQTVEGLQTVSGDPTTKVINLTQLSQTERGTLIILGDDSELIYSHDRGDTWQVGFNLELEAEGFQRWEVEGVTESNGRLVALVNRDRERGSGKENFAFISEDEGATWRRELFPVAQANTVLVSAGIGENGRLIAMGSNGAVYLSDALATDEDLIPNFTVREGESITLEVPRPPVGGDITVTYTLQSLSADGGNDFVQTAGQLTWLADDQTPQSITIDTIDDGFPESPEDLQVVFSLAGDLTISFNYDVTITDNEEQGAPGIDVLTDGPVQTSEDGATDTFRVVLLRSPAEDVTVNLTPDLTGEVDLQPSSVVFTATNWQTPQDITVTGLDDSTRDFNRTVMITLTTETTDPLYENLSPATTFIVNTDNEVDELIFQSGFE